MIALLEKNSMDKRGSVFGSGRRTVGIHLDISHDAPTPLGMTITCESELVEIDGRKLVFSVSAKDEKGTVIGRGTHERFVIFGRKIPEKSKSGFVRIKKEVQPHCSLLRLNLLFSFSKSIPHHLNTMLSILYLPGHNFHQLQNQRLSGFANLRSASC